MLKIQNSNQKTALFAALLGAVVMVLALFVPPVTGSADNGELVPVIEGNGLYKLDHGEEDEYFSYASVKYGVQQYHTEAEPVFTSRNVFIWAAKGLNFLFAKDKTVFDIRIYGALLCIYTLLALYLLVEYAAGKFQKGGVGIALAAVFIFCDTAYLTWILSFYEESVIYPSLLMLLACTLQLSETYHKSTKILGLFLISATLLVTVNNRTMLWGTLAGGLCLLILYRGKKKKGLALFQGKHGRYVKRLLAVFGILFLWTGIFFQVQNGKAGRTEQYHAMTRGMMMTAENPEEAVEFFGIHPSYTLLEDSSAYDRYPVIAIQNELLEENFYQKYDTKKAALYYASHWNTFGKMMQLIVNQAYTIHADTGGNYDRTAEKDGAKTTFFSLYSRKKEESVPRALGFLLILLVLFCLVNWKDAWSRMLFLYLMLMSVCLMAAIVVRSGAAEAARQLFLYNVSFDLLVFFLTAQCIHWIRTKIRKKKGKV